LPTVILKAVKACIGSNHHTKNLIWTSEESPQK